MQRRKGRGEVVKVSDLFAVYRNKLKAPEKTVITTVKEVLHDLYNIEVDESSISYKPTSRTIFLNLPGAFKTEILLQKKEVLNHLKGRLGAEGTPKEIL